MPRTTIKSEDIADTTVVAADLRDDSITNAKIKSDAAIEASKLESTLDLSGKTVTLPAASVTAHVTQTDTTPLEDDIALLGFHVASNGSLSKYNLADQAIDTFTDSTGIDSSSANETRVSGYVYGATSNYAGDGSDGTLSTSANVTHTVLNTNGSYDGDMLVKQYSSLTINAGHTMTVNQPCRGMFIYVSGDCIINGTLSMTGKGAAADPTASGGSDSNAVGANGLQLGLKTAGGAQTFTNDGTGFNGAGTAIRTAVANTANISSSGTIFSISQLGATGGVASGGNYYWQDGNDGTTGGTTISTGGGSTGQTQWASGSGNVSASGGRGGAFSAGSGGGGIGINNSGHHGNAGGDYGGAGGDGKNSGWSPVSCAGGAGNPGGSTAESGYGPITDAPDGVGGIIWLVVGGNLTIGANGKIEAEGLTGGSAYVDGGSSGGGAIFALYTGTYTVDNTNSTPISAAGGIHANTGQNSSYDGGDGGDGGFHTAALARTIGDLTLVSSTSTALAQPTKADVVLTYTNGVGTATVGTDLKVYASRDASTYTECTMTSQGTTGGHTILTAHDVDISSQPSGTDMRYKITTHNQSATKETRVHAVSLGWS
jgi:hypothetical protein